MKYCSTRGQVQGLSFSDAVMMGLADDGGLLLPEAIPQLSKQELQSMDQLPYPDLAFKIISKFATDIPAAELKEIIDRSYANFDHAQITPVIKQDDLYILELFHGPTFAFKDIALQFLGNLFEYLLTKNSQKMNIIGATSGDTGSAAIYGVRGKKNINIFILHPKGHVSPIQELQMTTVTDENVFNLAVEGTFDDAQSIVKEIFGDLQFKKQFSLGAVNSINWARVLAQVVYYFYAWYQVSQETGAEQIDVSVPTGNFGDIFAGYIAKQMGVPINQLILATNANNILSRCIKSGDYSMAEVHHSLSPSMDIQVASNFERYLYYLLDCNAQSVMQMMASFKQNGRLDFTADQKQRLKNDFSTSSINDEETLATIKSFYLENGYILDPHTAVGVAVGRKESNPQTPLVCLATAHPAKFGDTVKKATGQDPILPEALSKLTTCEKRLTTIPAEKNQVKDYIKENAT
ncbi:L-threonine synthase [Desulfuromusa kysingii]|uniref:Threonine synthase n=1 Tax=Desulfuromusa kysingii TaxID=37625 RepID=A0A1H4BF78_9BACT|nr:threonine synthase [Desulfuromusa kysingii]SEA46638.1 L-threonine synthase [Desulfuromusa kysingii]